MPIWNDNQYRERFHHLILFLIFFAAVLCILHGLPLTLDDFGFQNEHFSSNREAVKYILEFGNGRFFGNGGIIFMMHHLFLADVIRAAVIAGIAVLIPAALSLQGRIYPILTLFLLLSISPGLFGQAYSWMSGFQNYVPPVFLMLISLVLLKKENSGNLFQRTLRYAIILLLGICQQFYIEHSSCINLLTAFLLLVYAGRFRKAAFPAAVCYCLGTVIGLAAMFFATFLLAPEIHGGVQSYFSGGVLTLFRGILRNAVLLIGMSTENAVALGVFAVLLMIEIRKNRECFSTKQKRICLLGLSVPGAVFSASLFSGLRPWYGKLAAAESMLLLIGFITYMITALYVMALIIHATKNKTLAASGILLLMVIICIVPILLVWPTGYRCLFHSSVMLIAAILMLTDAVREQVLPQEKQKYLERAAALLLAATVLSQAAVFSDIRHMVRIREAYLAEEAAAGKGSADFFTIPSPYIYDVWNEENVHYTIIDGKAIRLDILPADVWFRLHYYHYT